MIENIQDTSILLIICFSVVAYFFKIEDWSDLTAGVWAIFFAGGLLTFIVTTLIRIWQ